MAFKVMTERHIGGATDVYKYQFYDQIYLMNVEVMILEVIWFHND